MRYDRDMGFARFQRPGGRRPFAPGFAYDADFGYDEDFEFGPPFDYDAEMAAAQRHYAEDFRDVRGRTHGWGMGYDGGALRSRGSYQAGQRRSGMNARDAFEFEWGDGYIGGRGYGGTNYDYQHGYATGAPRRARRSQSSQPEQQSQQSAPEREQSSPATRGGYEWGEERELYETFGPARYGLGPYHDRLQRPRRSDDEIQRDVEDTLFYDTWVDADRIQVSVREGVVTLSGELPDFQEIRYATDDAWDVEGVRGVRPELRVAGRQSSGRSDERAAGERENARESGRSDERASDERGAATSKTAAGGASKTRSAKRGGKKSGGK